MPDRPPHGLPIEAMLRDADEAWKIAVAKGVAVSLPIGTLLGDLACHIRALADALERQGRWIGVEEAMPVARIPHPYLRPRTADVLFLSHGRIVAGCYYPPCERAKDVWYSYGIDHRPEDVTHWQPLPPAPAPET